MSWCVTSRWPQEVGIGHRQTVSPHLSKPPKVMLLDCRSWMVWKPETNASQFRYVTVIPLQSNQCYSLLSPVLRKKTLLLSSEIQYLLKIPQVILLDCRSSTFRKSPTNVLLFRNVTVPLCSKLNTLFSNGHFPFVKQSLLLSSEAQHLHKLPSDNFTK